MKVIELLLIILIALTPLGQLGRINYGENIFFYLNDLLIPIILAIWFFYRLNVSKKIHVPIMGILLLTFFVWTGISLAHAAFTLGRTEFIVSALYFVRLILYSSLLFVAYDLVKAGKSKRLLITMVVTSLVVAIFGFIQLVVVPDFSAKAATEGWDPHQFRLLSTFYDPNFVGGFLAISLALCLAGFFKYQDRRVLLGFVAAVNFIAIVLTFSRSAYAATAVVLVVIALLKWRKLLLVLPFIAAAVFVIEPRALDRLTEQIAPGTSGYLRLISWSNSLTISQDNLLFGVGYNAYRYAQESYNFIQPTVAIGGNSGAGADSSLLLVLATTGVIGLLLWLALIFGALWVGWRAYRKGSIWGVALLASLPALLVHSIFLNSLFYQWIMLYLWIMIGASNAERD